MAKSNAAEAMPAEAPQEEEAPEVTDDMVVSEENLEDVEMSEAAKEKTELHKKKAKEETKRKKSMSKLRSDMADIKNKREESTAEIKEHLDFARRMSPEQEAAKEAEDRATAAELREMAQAKPAPAKEAEIKLSEEDLEEISGDPLSGSAEERIAYANMLKLPGFDHTGYNDLVMKKEKMEASMDAVESGEAKVGWFAKRRMKKALKKVLAELEPLEEELLDEVTDRQKESRSSKPMTPKEEKRWIHRQGMKR